MKADETYLNRPCPNIGSFDETNSLVELRFSLPITILIYVAYVLPFCFGVFGNISVCLIFFQQKKLRSITNTFLMNLCLNDLIVLCVSIPMTLSAALVENWVFGAFLCKFVHFTPTVTALVSTFTVAIIAVERWFFIVNKRKFDRRFTIVTLILLWLVSIIIALPEFISRRMEDRIPAAVRQEVLKRSQTSLNASNTSMIEQMFFPALCNKKKYDCVYPPDLPMRVFQYLVITVQYLVPFLFVSVSCYSISRFLKRRMIRMRSYQNHHRRPTRTSLRKKRRRSYNVTEETTELEVTSYDGTASLPTTLTNNVSSKTSDLFSCFRQVNEELNEHPNALNVVDQQQLLKCQSHTKRRFHRSRKLLISVALLFTISWLPVTIVQIYLEHSQNTLNPHFIYGYLLIPSYLISSLSACLNPVIYNYINRSFRREFYSLYSCCFTVSSSTDSRKEATTIGPKRLRPEVTHFDRVQTHLISPSVFKPSSQSVSFADEATIMACD
ncbi:unnamed protein product [Adineta ricciae]|uniref:G-protein coupled receptors family 1 profile domain-containing protein n=1 Tax=Adineta ricciae TaxID=249248 RepID=A0A813ZYI4_ADIRI|nr:unnamed protein product [Adineta ricciae]